MIRYVLRQAKGYAGISLLASGNSAALLMSFMRNLALAGMLSMESYGAAAAILIYVGLIEMVSNWGWHQLIVQSRDGDNVQFQSGLHGLCIIRGLIAALFLFLFGAEMAALLSVPNLSLSFQLLALVPVLKGFEHFDMHRLTRHNEFGPVAVFKIIPMACALLVVVPLLQFYDDYRVLFFSVLVQYGAGVAVSHCMARRPYRCTLDLSGARVALLFGWPLLVNNVLLFLVMQGDRIVVAQALGLEALALFSMGLTLIMAPASILSQTIAAFYLPRLSAVRDLPGCFSEWAHKTLRASLVTGGILVAGAYLIGQPLVPILLGADYAGLDGLLVLFALGQALRGLASGCATIALAAGQTLQPMVTSLVRVLVLPVAWMAANRDAGILELVWIALWGELLASLVSVALVCRVLTWGTSTRHLRDRVAEPQP